jgi:LPS export ABC transporter protein LptC
MKAFLTSFWLWGIILTLFIAIILWDDTLQETVTNAYVKHRMVLTNVNFSQVDKGFEQAKMHAEVVDMDDNQNNMHATNVRTLFFKEDNASFTGILLSDKALKNPFEAKFWGNIRGWSTDGDKIRTEELRYYFNRKELFTQKPVTIWKDNAVITGIGMRYNTQTKEAQINQQVMIRIWDQNASGTSKEIQNDVATVPVAPAPSELLNRPLFNANNASATNLPTSTQTATNSASITKQDVQNEKE